MTLYKRQTYSRYPSTYLSLFIILVIFSFSLQSGYDSSLQSGWIVNLVFNLFTFLHFPTQGYPLALIIRKVAHFSEYFVLGLTLPQTTKELNFPSLKYLIFIVPLLDESIQYFTPGRVMSMIDMGIDSLGLIVGYSIVKRVHKKT